MTTSSYAATSSSYLDSLINYVLDIKPYHTKLAATGAVSEGYLFSDTINVKITENESLVAYLGADLLPKVAVPGGGRARLSQSWWHDIISDGSTYTFSMPQISIPVFQSEASLSSFVSGTNDYTGIVGLTRGAFNPKRWDGPGITVVTRNGVQQQDTVHYTLSHGAYSFDVEAGGLWIEHDINSVTAFGTQSGALVYDPVQLSGGSITNITGGNYEEWTITTTYVDPSGVNPAQASVVGSVSGNIGTAYFNEQFIASQISFYWTYAPGETEETADVCASFTGSITGNVLTVTGSVTGRTGGIGINTLLTGNGVASGTIITAQLTGSDGLAGTYTVNMAQNVISTTMAAGDIWVLTPLNKITVANGAPVETWSIIKSNPIALNSAPVFTPGSARPDTPSIEIHTRSLDWTSEEVTWSIVFDGMGGYTLDRSAMANPNGISYPLTVELVNGCSFKNADIAFTLIPTVNGYNAGDTFTWTVGPTVANFKVYGSSSGWKADAMLGKWYWNGTIGFKIPRLTYFSDAANFTALGPVASFAEPSTYIITIIQATSESTPAKATVFNNIYGYREGMIQGQAWSDEYVSFQIDSPGDLTSYSVGDVIHVYLSPIDVYAASGGYEVQPYEQPPYDAGNINLTVPYLYDAELFPLFAHHGAVIWFGTSGTGTPLAIGDTIVIDKSFTDVINLQITNSSTNYPNLAPVNDWVPLKLRFFDNVDASSISNGAYNPTSTANYSDLATYIQAYSAADPNLLVFSILSPRFEKTDRTASSTLTFDQSFFQTYLPFNTHYSLQVEPDESYGQHIRVKVTENLKVYALIHLDVSDTIATVIVDDPIGYIDITTDMFLAEGPAAGYYSYEITSINPTVYSLVYKTPGPPESGYPFSIAVSDAMNTDVDKGSVDTSATGITDGLQILETTVATEAFYDMEPYDTAPYDEMSLTDPEFNAGQTRLSLTFDFNVLEPTGWTHPPTTGSESYGLLISAADEYLITMINKPGSVNYPPTLIVESTANLGTYGNPVPNSLPIYPQEPEATSADSFTFELPTGFTAPFRLWIV